jgi:hypothetical protein
MDPDARGACGEETGPIARDAGCAERADPEASASMGEDRGSCCRSCRCSPSLPEAIAPSLASTPTFARRDTSWCHALEV